MTGRSTQYVNCEAFYARYRTRMFKATEPARQRWASLGFDPPQEPRLTIQAVHVVVKEDND